MRRNGFTLIELLVVVAIIGALAAVGVVAYNGYTNAARINAVKANLNSVYKYISAEIMKCELGEETILEGYRPCAGFNSTAQINAMVNSYGDVIFSNYSDPYTGIKNCQTSTTNCVVRGSNEFKLGKISLDAVSEKKLIFKTCIAKPCNDSSNQITKTLTMN
tara:strand:- start:490 stop:975 length:486 start_codon:yes stop_codon:yes gene_type:complete